MNELFPGMTVIKRLTDYTISFTDLVKALKLPDGTRIKAVEIIDRSYNPLQEMFGISFQYLKIQTERPVTQENDEVL